MDIQTLLLMGGGQDPAAGGGITMLIWFGLIFAVMYLLLIRPQRKKQKEHENLLKELKKGDRVVTSSGMFGTIFAIDEDRGRVVIKISDEVKMEFLKSAIAARVDK